MTKRLQTLLDIVKPTPEEMAILCKEVARRAAVLFEECGQLEETAECWVEHGKRDRATELYLEKNRFAEAAPILLELKEYRKAPDGYRRWLDHIADSDIINRIKAELGEIACLKYLDEDLEPARKRFLKIRDLIEADQERQPFISARCWETLGDYGVIMNRSDLIHYGYETALSCYGDEYPEERLRVARILLNVLKVNRLFRKEIEDLIVKWKDTELTTARRITNSISQ